MSGFYGRTGNAALKSTDDIVFNNATAGIVTATNITVTGNLTVDGTTTTLDTELVGVDKLEVSANNTTATGIITQTGSGDILQLYDGSTKVVDFNQYGNLSITSTNPVFKSLHSTGNVTTTLFSRSSYGVVQTNSGHDLVLGTGGVEKVRVTSNGLVGIGTNNPDMTLHLYDSTAFAAFTNDGDTGESGILFRRHDNNHNRGKVTYNFTDDALIFRASNNGSGEDLRITSGGYVGIGTDNPSRLLHLHESSSNGTFLSFTNTTTGTTGADGALIGIQDDESLLISNKENNHIELHTDNKERLRITSGGGLKFISADSPTSTTEPAQWLNHSGGMQLYASSGTSTHRNIIFCSASNAASERLRIKSNGQVLINETSNDTINATLVVKTLTDNTHPTIKVRGTSSNGYTFLGDEYSTGDESQFTMGCAYSGASLVLGWGVKVSTSANNEYLSSQDTYSTKHSAIKHDGNGWRFLSNSSSQTVTTDSVVSLSEKFYIAPDGKIHIGGITSNDDINVGSGVGARLALIRDSTGNSSDGDLLGAISFQSYPTGQSHVSAEAAIKSYAETGQSGSSAPSDLRFFTKPNNVGQRIGIRKTSYNF